MKAKERERRWGDQYVLEKRHTQASTPGVTESPSPAVPTPDTVATGFGFEEAPTFKNQRLLRWGRRGIIRYWIANSFSLYWEAAARKK